VLSGLSFLSSSEYSESGIVSPGQILFLNKKHNITIKHIKIHITTISIFQGEKFDNFTELLVDLVSMDLVVEVIVVVWI